MDGDPLARVLIVEDDARFQSRLVEALSPRFRCIRTASTTLQAQALILDWRPELIILDVKLPDGDAFNIVRCIQRLDFMPVILAISGVASPEQSFLLATCGVRGYLPKPFDQVALDQALTHALRQPPDLRPHLRATVGLRPISEVEQEVRTTMLREALGRTGYNKSMAARLLQVSRQLLQFAIRKLDPEFPGGTS